MSAPTITYDGTRILDPEEPHMTVLARGHIGTTAWAICAFGDGLKIALKLHGERIFNLDINSSEEREGLRKFAMDLLAEGIAR